MAVGRRCPMGCETWPDSDKYSKCPKCEEPTKKFSGVEPLPNREAESIVNHIEFEKYYEQRSN